MITETPPNIDKCTLFQGGTRKAIIEKLNAFLAEGKTFKDVPLILTADGRSRRFKYKGISIREWYCDGNVRYDAAVELI